MRGLTEEGVDARGDDDDLDLALLARGARVDAAAGVLGDREALASESGLVDLERVALEQARVGRDDVAELDAYDVPGDEDRRILVTLAAVAEHLGPGREVGHELLGGAPGAVLLPERDGGVEDEEHDDADEVLPVRWPVVAIGEHDGHDCGTLHHPRQRVPHEP